MKILIFEDSAVLGGTKRSLAEFAAAAGRDSEVTVLSPSSPLSEARDNIHLSRLRLPAKPYHPLGRFVLAVSEIFALAAAASRESPDVIVTMNLRGHIAGGLLASLARAKVGWYLLDYTPRITRMGRLLPMLSRHVRGAAVLSEAQSRAFSGYLKCPLFTIPPGVDPATAVPTPEERAELRRKQALPADRILVGMVARIAPEKGIEVFLKVAEALDDERFAFVVTGETGDASYLKQLNKAIAESPSKTRVTLRQPTPDRAAIYGPLDIILLPFVRREGFGRSVLEAMAAGLATVVSDVEPMREIITDGSDGLIAPPGDIERFTEILRSLRDPALRHRIGSEAHRSAISRFPLEQYQVRVRAFLDALMNKPTAITNTHT